MKLARITIQNFKSIKSLDLRAPPDLVVFVGKNDAGKSNIFDVLNFLSQATQNLSSALSRRGGSFREVVRKKQDTNEVLVKVEFEVQEEFRQEVLRDLFDGNSALAVDAVVATPFLVRVILFSGDDYAGLPGE